MGQELRLRRNAWRDRPTIGGGIPHARAAQGHELEYHDRSQRFIGRADAGRCLRRDRAGTAKLAARVRRHEVPRRAEDRRRSGGGRAGWPVPPARAAGVRTTSGLLAFAGFLPPLGHDPGDGRVRHPVRDVAAGIERQVHADGQWRRGWRDRPRLAVDPLLRGYAVANTDTGIGAGGDLRAGNPQSSSIISTGPCTSSPSSARRLRPSGTAGPRIGRTGSGARRVDVKA